MYLGSFIVLGLVSVVVIAVVSRVRTVRRRQLLREQLGSLESAFSEVRASVARLTTQVNELQQRIGAEVPVPQAPVATRRRRSRSAAAAVAPSVVAEAAGSEPLPLPLEAPQDVAAAASTEAVDHFAHIVAPDFSISWSTTREEKKPKPRPARPGFISRAFSAIAQGLGQILGLKRGEAVNWEAIVGGRWLNLLGMLILVVGIVLLSQQALLYLPPAGKVAFGAALALGMLLGGMLLERSEAYRWIGRTLIGGGWALAYFDAYAAYNVEQAKVIDSPVIALVVLIAVAVGVITHALRYRSQVVVGIAFGLAFLAIVLTPVTVASLVAAAILAAGLAAVARVLSWSYLAAAGVAGTYVNHWIWLQKVAHATAPGTALTSGAWFDAALPPEAVFWLSCGILVFYWLMFSWASLRKASNNRGPDEALYLIVGLANTLGVIALLYAQMTYAFGEHYRWAITAPAALSCAGLAFVDRRLGQRLLFLANGLLALLAYTATLPLATLEYGWQWGWVGPYLAAGALVTVIVGVRTKESIVRLGGYAVAAVGFLNVMMVGLWEAGATTIDARWLSIVAMICAYQVAAELLRRNKIDRGLAANAFGIAATLMLAGLIWIHTPHTFVGPLWMVLGLVVTEFGLRRDSGHELQGYALILLATASALSVNVYGLGGDANWLSWVPGWVPPVAVAVGLYYCFVRSRDEAIRPKLVPWVGDAASALASLLIALATWKDLPSLGVAPVWAALGLALFEAAPRFQAPLLRIEAHIVMTAAFARLFMANLVVDGDLSGVSFRLLTAVPVVLILIYLRYQMPGIPTIKEQKGLMAGLLRREPVVAAGLYSWAAAILLVMLFRFEFGRAHTVAAWAPLLLAMLYAGQRFNDRNLRFQSYVLGAYSLFRGWSTNIYLDGLWLGLDERLSTTMPMIVSLLVASLLCRGSLGEGTESMAAGRIVRLLGVAERNGAAYFAFLGIGLLSVLLYFQLPPDFVSIGLALEGLTVLAGGFLLRERGYRILGLVVLLATLVKAVFIDLAGVEEIYRIASFIVLGVILLLASVGYTRYRGLMEKYL